MMTGDNLQNAHNNVFVRALDTVEKLNTFLKKTLPASLSAAIDYSKTEISSTTYVSDDVVGHYSDIVVKTMMKTTGDTTAPADIYILIEHKSVGSKKGLMQMLKYQYLEWKKDSDEGKPLRVIIPMIFYHGENKWNVPRSFGGQFEVSPEIKEYMLDYKYVFFDTREYDFFDKANEDLRENVFLFTSLVLLKNAYNDDMNVIESIFRFWQRKGFIEETDLVMFFLRYIMEIRDVPLDQLQKKIEECKINGGEIMPSLAQRLRDEGKEIGMNQGMTQGYKQGINDGINQGLTQGLTQGVTLGKDESKKEIARLMLLDKLPIETIIRFTGLAQEDILALQK